MAMPDYSQEQLEARSQARETFKPGTLVRHAYTGQRTGRIVKLHTGTLKRPKPLYKWTATVDWSQQADDNDLTRAVVSTVASRADLSLLRPVVPDVP